MITMLPLMLAALTPAQAQDIRCVALLAVVADGQVRGTGWRDMRVLKDDGARYAGVVGENVMSEGERTREGVRDLILAEVARLQKAGEPARLDIDQCIVRMDARVPPPTLPRCAAILSLAYDAVRGRDGLTKDAKDLATLASVLAYRARVEGEGRGQSATQVEAAIGTAKAEAAKAGAVDDDELARCADFAAPDR